MLFLMKYCLKFAILIPQIVPLNRDYSKSEFQKNYLSTFIYYLLSIPNRSLI